MNKKFIMWIIGTAALLSTSGFTKAYAVQNLKFTDVPEDKYFAEPVAYGVEAGIIDNTENFNPYNEVTRGMFATMLYKKEGRTELEDKNNPFRNVKEGKWYYDAVLLAYENGIITGYDDRPEFNPEKSVSRQDIMVMLARYARYKGIDTSVNNIDLSKYAFYDVEYHGTASGASWGALSMN